MMSSSSTGRTAACAIFMVLALSVAIAAEAAAPSCNEQDARRAETEASTLTTWKDVFNSYSRFSNCDDGAIAEGYSNSVATLLADHWDQANELVRLARAHPKFEVFVLRHLDQTMTEMQERTIKVNVESACSRNTQRLCDAIKKRLKVLDSE
jgi:hypothetical protein